MDCFIFRHRFRITRPKISEIQTRPKCCRKILNWQSQKHKIIKINESIGNYHLILSSIIKFHKILFLSQVAAYLALDLD
jgi:hypothetical protein